MKCPTCKQPALPKLKEWEWYWITIKEDKSTLPGQWLGNGFWADGDYFKINEVVVLKHIPRPNIK